VDHYGAWVFEKLRRKEVNRSALHDLLTGKFTGKSYAMGGLVNSLNSLRLPEIPKFAMGGPVGFAAGGEAAAPSVSGATMTVNLNFGGGDMIPVTTSSTADARRLVKKLEWMAQRSSR